MTRRNESSPFAPAGIAAAAFVLCDAYSTGAVATLTPASVAAHAHTLLEALTGPGPAPMDRALPRKRLTERVRTEIGSAATLVRPDALGVSFGNGLHWMPGPVVQSYAAYTPSLDAGDAATISTAPPPFALLGFASIDDRYWAGNEPSHTGAYFAHTRSIWRCANPWLPTADDHFSSCVQRTTVAGRRARSRTAVAHWSEPLEIPAAHGIISACVDVRPTLFGKLAALALRSPAVHGVRSDTRPR